MLHSTAVKIPLVSPARQSVAQRGSGGGCQGDRGIPERSEDMPRKPLDSPRNPEADPARGNGNRCPSCLTASDRAAVTGQGTGPLQGLGQRPKVFVIQLLSRRAAAAENL